MAKYHKPDYVLIVIIAAVLIFGLIALASASSVVGFSKFGDIFYYIKRQLLIGVLLGIICLFVAYKLDYHWYQKYAFYFLIISVILLILVFIPGIGFNLKGAHRWIKIGGFLFQPTEVVKLTFLIYLATWLSKREKDIKDFQAGLLPFLIVVGLISLLIIFQPDVGSMSVIAFIAFSVYFVAGAPIKHLGFLGTAGLVIFYLLIKFKPYRAARLTVFLNPQVDPQGIGYHINQALLAIGSGGFFGLGLGRSRQKYNYLPEVAGDSIFAVIAEELGFIIVAGLIVLFVLIMYRGFKIAKHAPDIFGKLMATGIVAWISYQAFVNIAANLAVVPLTGITLPFISYGSSSLVVSLTAMGILFNISRQTTEGVKEIKWRRQYKR